LYGRGYERGSVGRERGFRQSLDHRGCIALIGSSVTAPQENGYYYGRALYTQRPSQSIGIQMR
jgi:hypothetical protein